MLTDRYPFESSEDFLKFEFKSIGPSGVVTKVVRYTETAVSNVYNLGFGDLDYTGSVNDLIVTDNKDTRKVLATVVQTLYAFANRYPNIIVIAIGSTES